MTDLENRVSEIILAQLRIRNPELGPSDLARPIADLDLDSLDLVELHQHLESELKVKGDLNESVSLAFLDDYVTYFTKLASRG